MGQDPVSVGSGHDQRSVNLIRPDGWFPMREVKDERSPDSDSPEDDFYDAAKTAAKRLARGGDSPSNTCGHGPVPCLRVVTRNDSPAPATLKDATPPKLTLIYLEPERFLGTTSENIARKLTRNWDHLFAVEPDGVPADLFTGVPAERKRPS